MADGGWLPSLMHSELVGRALRRPAARRFASRAGVALRRVHGDLRRAIPRHRAVARTNPANPTVGVAMMAQDAATLLPTALSADLLAVVDDVVVVDGGSVDDTVDVALALGARVVHAPFPDKGFGRQQTRALHASRADWVLIVDADEIASSSLVHGLHDLIRTQRYTGWWLPRRWLVRDVGALGWIASPPHWPDYQARLARRLPGVRYVGAIHPTLAGSSPGPWGLARGYPLVHLDLVLSSREARERKVAARQHLPGFAGTESFYLWEGMGARVRALPPGDRAVHEALSALLRSLG